MGPAGRTSSSAGIPSVQSNTLGISVTVQKWLHIVASPRTHTNITFTIFSHQMIDHPLHMQYSGNETQIHALYLVEFPSGCIQICVGFKPCLTCSRNRIIIQKQDTWCNNQNRIQQIKSVDKVTVPFLNLFSWKHGCTSPLLAHALQPENHKAIL